ncbi:hypothetical protein [Sorangium atrum]|uniref:Uncharacterized protein n=1 Tax=Sorangium atrum TaxID=2995308 RepID=A0ABT5BQ02_9BACT|nr:hypothetical protein [Sorangium aterium]MDC0676235.1 hypothetical protein [Sorangium aterium]
MYSTFFDATSASAGWSTSGGGGSTAGGGGSTAGGGGSTAGGGGSTAGGGGSTAGGGGSTAGGGGSTAGGGGGTGGEDCQDDLSGLCDCVKDVLKDIKHADKNGAGKVKHADEVLDKVKDELKWCVKAFCKDVDSHDSCD